MSIDIFTFPPLIIVSVIEISKIHEVISLGKYKLKYLYHYYLFLQQNIYKD